MRETGICIGSHDFLSVQRTKHTLTRSVQRRRAHAKFKVRTPCIARAQQLTNDYEKEVVVDEEEQEENKNGREF